MLEWAVPSLDCRVGMRIAAGLLDNDTKPKLLKTKTKQNKSVDGSVSLQAGGVKKLTRYAPTRFEMDLRAFNCHRIATINIAQGFKCLLDGHRLALRSVHSCVRKPRGWRVRGVN